MDGLAPRPHLPLPRSARALAIIVGFVALLAAYGPGLRLDVPVPSDPPSPPADAAEQAWHERADANRRQGRTDAPLVLELAIDFQCPHCAESYDRLIAMLAPAVTEGTLEIVVRHAVRPSEPASHDLAGWAFAAAAESGAAYRAYVGGMLGTRDGVLTADLLHGPMAEPLRLAERKRQASQHATVIATLVDSDSIRLRELGFKGRTPLAELRDRHGRRLGRWETEITPSAVLATLAQFGSMPPP
jgi:hypothetical protein